MHTPSEKFLNELSSTITCPQGSMIVFDSILWHAAGVNVSNENRLAINYQLIYSYIKQQIDYCRDFDYERIINLAPRTQQLLGIIQRLSLLWMNITNQRKRDFIEGHKVKKILRGPLLI